LKAQSSLLGIDPDLAGLRHQKTLSSLGAKHVIFQQFFEGRRIHRAYVTVHLSNKGSVYLAKNKAVPQQLLPKRVKFKINKLEAAQRARSCLAGKTRQAIVQTTEELWFPEGKRLVPAWRVRLVRAKPQEEWIIYIHAATGRVLSRYDSLSKAIGQGLVFDPSPVTKLDGHEDLLSMGKRQRKPPASAYVTVALPDLKGNGRLEGKRVTTAPTLASRRIQRADHQFLLASHQKGYEEVMVYYHIDQAIRYLEQLGFRGTRAIFRDPVGVNVNGTREDNSWYSPWDKRLTFGTGEIDDAEDGETVLHEFGHAIQDAIIPDFGQSEEEAAIGEGFGDYFAASFFADKKPEWYQTSVMTWDGLLIGLKKGLDPPYLRRVDNVWTCDEFVVGDDEHDNGEIWSAILWDIREELGRETADRMIIESHFQLDGFTTFARHARAIIDADANLNGGGNRDVLRKIFRRRRITQM
jgi:hypothetical protein